MFVTDEADQLSIILTMFLTAVAFQFVLSSNLPNKPYMTWTDRYIVRTTLSPSLM
eukprot:COSAG01_NODE_22271_length_863_cov_1.274869_1_plen_55_part_00